MVAMKYLWLLTTVLILSCSVKEVSRPTTTAKNKTLPYPLILDGRPYVDEGKAYRKNEAHLITSIACNFSSDFADRWHSFEGMEQLVNLKFLSIRGDGEFLNTVDFTPLASLSKLEDLTLRNGVVHRYNFKGLGQLGNLKSLEIEDEGDNLSEIDLALLASLPKLKTLGFGGNITRLPDLTRLTNLRSFSIDGKINHLPDLSKLTDLRFIYIRGMLESLEGIGAPNVRRIEIKNSGNLDSLAPLSNLTYLEELYIVLSIQADQAEKEYKMADIANLPSLKYLYIKGDYSKIDLQDIENLSALEILSVLDCKPFNIEGIGKLSKLEKLQINLISPEPSTMLLFSSSLHVPSVLLLGSFSSLPQLLFFPLTLQWVLFFSRCTSFDGYEYTRLLKRQNKTLLFHFIT
jgi:hypothetical protein